MKTNLLEYNDEKIKLECISDTLQNCFKECFDFLNLHSKNIITTICKHVCKFLFFVFLYFFLMLPCRWIEIFIKI